MREMQEELGVLITTPIPLGYVHDYYHLIKRENYQYYFYAKVKGYTVNHWTEGEKRRFHALHWLSLDAAILWYEQLANNGISRLIKQRELPVLYFLKNQGKFLVSARD
jgi:8-oxo-dGTP pyrophosphatase MutT (NUDIX family)